MTKAQVARIILENCNNVEQLDWLEIMTQLLNRLEQAETDLARAEESLEAKTASLLTILKEAATRLKQNPQTTGSREAIAAYIDEALASRKV